MQYFSSSLQVTTCEKVAEGAIKKEEEEAEDAAIVVLRRRKKRGSKIPYEQNKKILEEDKTEGN